MTMSTFSQPWLASVPMHARHPIDVDVEVITFAEFILTISARGMVEMANDEDLALRILSKFRERTER